MNKIKLLFILVLLAILASVQDGQAQRKRRSSDVDEYFDESGSWRGRIWYGLGFDLPSFTGNGSGNTQFTVGLAPMVGVKILEGNDNLSVGPRVSLTYWYLKLFDFSANDFVASQALSYTISGFARYKIIPQLFVHTELEYENRVVNLDFSNPGNPEAIRQTRQNFYVGAGYQSGAGVWGYELSGLYNVNEPSNSPFTPFNFRVAVNYNF